MTSLKRNWHFAAFLAAVLAVSGCGGGGGSSATSGGGSGGGAPLPVTNPSTAPSSGPVNTAAYVCPTSDTDTASSERAVLSRGLVRRAPMTHGNLAATPPSSLLAVTYNRATLRSARTSFALSEARAGGLFKREFDFPHIGLTTRILAVAPERASSIEATLRAQPGVHSVGAAGARRYPLAVTAPYFSNDPYFTGFPNPIPTPVGNTTNPGSAVPPPTYEQLPYAENGSVPGQWNLHATRLEEAFGYSVAGNGTAYSANALGTSSVKIAIIDSGADTTQPDLGPKIAYQRCFITSADGTTQSTSDYVTDPDGHGTDVSALAGASTNNGFGFASAGGKSTLYEYRVDPTPDDTCVPGSTKADAQCGASDLDIISAIGDAVQNGVNVINLSLGATENATTSGCSSPGVDYDMAEQNAINDALAANVIVVAASGNDKALQDAPGCDSGVIAAGASALADGSPNGAGNSNGSPSAPIEYVATYSSYGSPGAAYRNASAWGIVAPGGDPDSATNVSDYDFLHWVYDLYTSTPFDTADAGSCGIDYPYTAATPKSCTILIAGTSMASPTVAGAAALILAVNRAYQSPTRMKQLLCSTTDDINDSREGCGRLNVYRAMAVALGDPTPP